jgi:hypothetical protein
MSEESIAIMSVVQHRMSNIFEKNQSNRKSSKGITYLIDSFRELLNIS